MFRHHKPDPRSVPRSQPDNSELGSRACLVNQDTDIGVASARAFRLPVLRVKCREYAWGGSMEWSDRGESCSALACALLAGNLLSPALTSVHVEGFSVKYSRLSEALIHGGISSHDPYLPLITEFIFLTARSVVDLLHCCAQRWASTVMWRFECLTM